MTKRGQAVPKTNRFLSLPLLTYHRLQWLWRTKGTKLSHAAVEALTRWAQDVEREAWISGELSKEAEQPFPPARWQVPPGRPRGAANTGTLSYTFAINDHLQRRTTNAVTWLRLRHSWVMDEALRGWLGLPERAAAAADEARSA